MRANDEMKVLPRELKRVRERFEGWRRRRDRRRIPERLWSQAASVAVRHGVSRTARALRLNALVLRKRVAAAARVEKAAVPPATRASFVELATIPLSADRAGYVLEVESAGGDRLRLEVRGSVGPDVVALARGFVGDER